MMKRIKVFLIFCFLLLALSPVRASSVDTATTFSASMNKAIKAVVIKPDSYASGKAFPVVYLLHGYSDNFKGWISKVPQISRMADQYQVLIVCPDGNFASWYFDSPVDTAWKYETYISKELVGWIDKQYNTIRDRKARAITGLSMGGHGALYNAFKHQDVFGAAGSMSGGVDLRPFPNNWAIAERLGAYSTYPERWEGNSVINLTHLLTPKALSIIVDCGTEDFFYGVNRKLHETLLERNIPHDFISRPGGHTWEYWSNAIGYQMMYFSNFFNRK